MALSIVLVVICISIIFGFLYEYYHKEDNITTVVNYSVHLSQSHDFALRNNLTYQAINYDYFIKFLDRNINWYSLDYIDSPNIFRIPKNAEQASNDSDFNKCPEFVYYGLIVFERRCFYAETYTDYCEIMSRLKKFCSMNSNVKHYPSHHEMWNDVFHPLLENDVNEIRKKIDSITPDF